ncbi:hypothetical protein J2739_004927 [Variovorax soli]|uniref:Uncharacterized protein n=1 Tax=Variovorax soli TaxID=376815 RepID=A0ABU1NMM2_9BURK|nr:hypothetical protein [Variovorax soli]
MHPMFSIERGVEICAVFFASPRLGTLVKPNCCLITRNGCLARRLLIAGATYSTVTLFARFLGLSTSVPRAQAVW